MERYQPRFKYIRDNSKLVLEDLKADFQKLPFSTVYAMEDPEDKLDIFNSLVTMYRSTCTYKTNKMHQTYSTLVKKS